jgi:hypothetical protein
MYKSLISKLKAAAAGGGGGQLPPVAPAKVKPKQQSWPGYVTSTRTSDALINKVDPGLANVDITSTYRLGRSTNEVLRNLVRANPDLSAACAAYLRVGIPERYIVLAHDPDGTVNDDATRYAWEIMQRFDKLPAYDSGFSQVDSIRSNSEALAKEGLLYGGLAMELVLDKGRMPYKFQPVHVPSLKFYPDNAGGTKGLKPVQDVGGEEIDLDIATFFMVWIDPSLLDAYTQSPLEAAIQPVLASSQFFADMRRLLQRHVYPRYDVMIDEEKLRNFIPPEVLADEEQLPAYMNTVISDVETTINNLGVDEALVHFDFITLQYIKNDDGQGVAEKFAKVKEILDANLAKGARTMPAVLGNGSGSQNVASSETTLFMLSANSMVRMKLQELYSKALTLAVRLGGADVTVSFEFDPIELRPETELHAFKTQYHEGIKDKWSLGLMSDMEASMRLMYKPTPKTFQPLSGTYFMTGGDPNGQAAAKAGLENAYSGTGVGGGQSGGGADTQSRKSNAPTEKKGGQKK